MILAICLGCLSLSSCAQRDTHHKIVVSIPDQKMILYNDSQAIAEYDISTSKYGLGDRLGSCATPLGDLEVERKIGTSVPAGGVLKSRRFTGEVLQPDAPGRDPIVTRILWLRGLDSENRNAYGRCIYIHGTPEERNIGHPASYGCIRMRSMDVINLYDTVGIGAKVEIINAIWSAPGPAPARSAQIVQRRRRLSAPENGRASNAGLNFSRISAFSAASAQRVFGLKNTRRCLPADFVMRFATGRLRAPSRNSKFPAGASSCPPPGFHRARKRLKKVRAALRLLQSASFSRASETDHTLLRDASAEIAGTRGADANLRALTQTLRADSGSDRLRFSCAHSAAAGEGKERAVFTGKRGSPRCTAPPR